MVRLSAKTDIQTFSNDTSVLITHENKQVRYFNGRKYITYRQVDFGTTTSRGDRFYWGSSFSASYLVTEELRGFGTITRPNWTAPHRQTVFMNSPADTLAAVLILTPDGSNVAPF